MTAGSTFSWRWSLSQGHKNSLLLALALFVAGLLCCKSHQRIKYTKVKKETHHCFFNTFFWGLLIFDGNTTCAHQPYTRTWYLDPNNQCLWRCCGRYGLIPSGQSWSRMVLSDTFDMSQWFQLQFLLLVQTCYGNVTADSLGPVLLLWRVLDQIWDGHCRIQWCENAQRGVQQ